MARHGVDLETFYIALRPGRAAGARCHIHDQHRESRRRSRRRRPPLAESWSADVEGTHGTVPISESHAAQPQRSYGIHKLAIQHYLAMYHAPCGLEYCVLRLANPFGERQRPDRSQGALAVFLDKALRGDEITVGRWIGRARLRLRQRCGAGLLRAVAPPEPTGLSNIGPRTARQRSSLDGRRCSDARSSIVTSNHGPLTFQSTSWTLGTRRTSPGTRSRARWARSKRCDIARLFLRVS